MWSERRFISPSAASDQQNQSPLRPQRISATSWTPNRNFTMRESACTPRHPVTDASFSRRDYPAGLCSKWPGLSGIMSKKAGLFGIMRDSSRGDPKIIPNNPDNPGLRRALALIHPSPRRRRLGGGRRARGGAATWAAAGVGGLGRARAARHRIHRAFYVMRPPRVTSHSHTPSRAVSHRREIVWSGHRALLWSSH